jgi:predicted transcriptional regulator
MKKKRYKLKRDGETIVETSYIREIAEFLGCTREHIYKYIKGNQFSYKKITYMIIDKLDEN